MKRKRIKNITFAFEGAHLAITDWSQGGAASFENDAILFKANEEVELTAEQKKLLEEVFEEEFKPLVIKTSDLKKTSSSSSEGGAEDDNQRNEGNSEEMSEEILKEMAALKAQNEAMAAALKAIEVKKVEDKVAVYSLPDDIAKSLSELSVELGEKADVVYKALDAIVEAKQATQKAADQASPSDLAKALGAEVGNLEKAEAESQAAKIKKAVQSIRKEFK